MKLFQKTQKIPCYVLVFKEVSIIDESLSFLTSLSDEFEIIIIENPSINSPAIKKLVDKLGEQGKIARYYLFDENITNNAYSVILEHEIKLIASAPYVLVSDGDITMSDGRSWLKEAKKLLKYKDVFCCGAGMLTDNLPLATFPDANTWLPEPISTHPFEEARTGCHMLLMTGDHMARFLTWKTENKRFFTDGDLARYCYKVMKMKWARTRDNKVYHLTWDLYKDPTNEYTKLKTSQSFADTWYHDRTATFSVTTY